MLVIPSNQIHVDPSIFQSHWVKAGINGLKLFPNRDVSPAHVMVTSLHSLLIIERIDLLKNDLDFIKRVEDYSRVLFCVIFRIILKLKPFSNSKSDISPIKIAIISFNELNHIEAINIQLDLVRRLHLKAILRPEEIPIGEFIKEIVIYLIQVHILL